MTSERRAHRDRSNRRSRAASPTTRVWRALAVAMPVTVILLAVAAVQTGAISRFGDWLLGPTTTAARLTTTNQSDGGPVTYPPAAIRGGALPERTGTAARGAGEAQDGDRGGAAQARRTTTATSAAKSARTAKTAKTRSGTTTTSTPAQQSTTTSTTGSAGETTTSTAAPTTSTSTTTAPQTTTTTSTPATTTQAPSSDQATEVIRLTNAARAANGCSVALKADGKLTNAAQGHSADMAAKNYFSHTGLDGRSPFDRMRDAGYSYSMAAENIAAGQPTPAAVVNGWMNSSGHRANILNCKLTEIGVGVAKGGSYGIYWTQVFGTPR